MTSSAIDFVRKEPRAIAAAALGFASGVLLSVVLLKKRKTRPLGINGMNQAKAGPRSTRELPVGSAPLQLYSFATPNGIKVSIALEEMGLVYDAHRIDIMKGDQFTSGFVNVNYNSKIPALVDREGSEGRVDIFESGAILIYLAEKTGLFLPRSGTARADTLKWLFWQHGGLGPMAGQFGHFFRYTSEKIDYALDRYGNEVRRLLSVLEHQLKGKSFVTGEEYTIADMAIFPWIRTIASGYDAAEYFALQAQYPTVMAWAKRIEQRPAVQRAIKVCAL